MIEESRLDVEAGRLLNHMTLKNAEKFRATDEYISERDLKYTPIDER